MSILRIKSVQFEKQHADTWQLLIYKIIVAITLIIAVVGIIKLLNIWERRLLETTQEELYKRLWVNENRETM